MVGQVLGSREQRGAVSPTLDSLGISDAVAALPSQSLLNLRRLRLNGLVRDFPQTLELDDDGNPVRKGELIAIDPDPQSLRAAVAAGFGVLNESNELGFRTVMLQLPKGTNTRKALKRIRKLAPAMEVELNHVYEPAGGALMVASGAALVAHGEPRTGGARIAMIDGGVAAHPSLAGASIEQHGFAGAIKPTGHGTAVASLLVGNDGAFRGAIRGAPLLVADVYGGSRAAGSAIAVAKALAWAVAKNPNVINISLVGPPNKLLERAIRMVAAKNIAVVAAVGNDGPAAPPQYPASYPVVVAATGVDVHDRALPEAGRPTELDFAAPGADLAAALPGRGYAKVRGTSFAAPFVTARLATTGSLTKLSREAVPGKGRVGKGIVCNTCRIEPKSVGAK
jgi:subtilisin family serine protease